MMVMIRIRGIDLSDVCELKGVPEACHTHE